jgi:Haem-NO-binding
MYGLVNRAVEKLVCSRFGEPAWERIKTRAGVDVEYFASNESYPDEMTYALVAAASAELGTPPEAILEAFGEYWILEVAPAGYGAMLARAGSTLPDFLENLPHFHTRVAMIFPNLQPPLLETSDRTASSLRLHYRSHRAGLEPFLLGIIRGLGKRFGVAVDVRHLARRTDGADHDIFLVDWSADPTQ